jgi:hypothetical protein
LPPIECQLLHAAASGSHNPDVGLLAALGFVLDGGLMKRGAHLALTLAAVVNFIAMDRPRRASPPELATRRQAALHGLPDVDTGPITNSKLH